MTTPLIPRSVLFGNPENISPEISPDATMLGYIAPLNGVLNVWVRPLNGGEARPITQDTDRGIRQFVWAHDGKHLLYVQDVGGDENWHIYAVDVADETTRDITPFEGVQARLLDIDKKFPTTVMIAMNKDNPELHDLYRFDLATDSLELVAKNPGFVSWIIDADFNARGAATMTPEGELKIFYRADVTDENITAWREVYSVGADDGLNTSPVGFKLDGKTLFLISSKDANAGRLLELDCETGTEKELFRDEIYDVSGIRLHPDTRELQMVAIRKARTENHFFDADLEVDFAQAAQLSEGDAFIESADDEDDVWVVGFVNDSTSVNYYVFERGTNNGKFLFTARPELDKYVLASMEPFEFKSRDGLDIHGYISYPEGVERTNLPAVLNVHGGPWARDTWGYNPEAQWMTNRGYACIQVNFRGSTGYGKDFVNAGDREWGAKMHDDLLDAIDYFVAKGEIDPQKVAIYGGSYGGYAALVGAAFTPERFCCSVDIVGPSNLKTLIESIPPYWAPMVAQFHNRVGNPATDEGFLWERSPLSKADNVSIPLLIAQGANDPRVKQAEAEQIVAALKANNIECQYELYEDEGHGFYKPENRLDFYAKAEKFLAEHLGGRAEE